MVRGSAAENGETCGFPRSIRQDWRPYTLGHWVYTNDYGWYWASAPEEAGWGLITFHYGHWVDDDEFGWIWVPATRWGPGWVQWRRGTGYVGWAPLPPDGGYANRPDAWVFVRERDLVAPVIADVLLPPNELYFQDTVVVNRTQFLDRGFAANPGIPPAYVAAAYGRPIPQYEICPRVLAGTGNLPGALVVRPEDIRSRERLREIANEFMFGRETSRIKPATRIPPPRAFGQDERGRFGQFPPDERGRPGIPGINNGTDRRATQGRLPFGEAPARLDENGRPGVNGGRGVERLERQGRAPFGQQPQPGVISGQPKLGQGESRPNGRMADPRVPGELRRGPSTTGAAPSNDRRGERIEQGADRVGRQFPGPEQRSFGRATPPQRAADQGPVAGEGARGAPGSGQRIGGGQRSFERPMERPAAQGYGGGGAGARTGASGFGQRMGGAQGSYGGGLPQHGPSLGGVGHGPTTSGTAPSRGGRGARE